MSVLLITKSNPTLQKKNLLEEFYKKNSNHDFVLIFSSRWSIIRQTVSLGGLCDLER